MAVLAVVRRLAACDLGAQSLEASLVKGERMRLLGQVSGGLAHQIRNGVAGAKLAIQLHARSCSDADGDSLEAARRQLARVEADLSRYLDLGRDDVPRRPCHVVEKLVEEAARCWSARNVAMRTCRLVLASRRSSTRSCWAIPAGSGISSSTCSPMPSKQRARMAEGRSDRGPFRTGTAAVRH